MLDAGLDSFKSFKKKTGAELQGRTRPIFWDETETKKLGLSKITTRPRPRNSEC